MSSKNTNRPIHRWHHKNKAISYTLNRFEYDRLLGVVTDVANGDIIQLIDGYFHLNDFIFNKLTEAEAWMLTHKPLNIPAWDFIRAWKNNEIKIIGNSRNPSKDTTFWKFKIESSYYPGFYYIPGYTNYVVNESGRVISLFKGIELRFHSNGDGYLTANMVSDDSLNGVVPIHPLVAFTFKDWSLEDVINNEIDHIDGNTENTHESNLEFVSQAENIKRIARNNYYGKRTHHCDIYYRDLKTGEKGIVKTQRELANRISDLGASTIQNHLSKSKPNATLKSRYVIAYVKDESDIQYLDGLDAKYFDLRSGSQARATLIKNISTGEIKRFDKMRDAFNYISSIINITFKPFSDRLAKGIQKDFDGYIFKYEDITDDWIL